MTSATEPALSGRELELQSTVAGHAAFDLVVKRSRFVTSLTHVASMDEAEATIAEARRDRWDARHHCVALVVGPHAEIARSTDDGEPAGTAGMPMAEVLRRHELTDVVAVVARYFGGVLLGTGGLARAYGAAVEGAVSAAQVVRRRLVDRVTVCSPHESAGRTEHFLRDWSTAHEAVVVGVTYTGTAVLEMLVPPDVRARLDSDLASFSAGRLTTETVGPEIMDVPTQ
ncbi:IMPACT family protein [Sanguibacter antarcticus]|uniref:Putative YigZ family protein n=1 Tax=Sanguibacter antarcticus TaxID=372484 RepID=A0A2A9E482_9MICO|nr:YigZ family protein [Sanguibacter antarcticus]PFG33165.1 putative YigZ family protein [Sanguibacter antarcticus]